ncbi:hypothetical protein WOC76_04420 [Methylocystis sp. IM3]|uniref:hypothetical protein n=1 Tax=unclassified Methylocystis TaxID=2625913 RepID=UPI0030F6DE6B
MAAIKKLGRESIDALVVTIDDLRAELAMIDENLMRSNYTPAQQAAAVSRRKAIYEELHPETRAGVSGGKARQKSASDNLSFAEITAEATGKDRRTIERAAARGKALGDDIDGLEGTSLDKGYELDALAKMTPDERKPLIDRAKAGERVSARADSAFAFPA